MAIGLTARPLAFYFNDIQTDHVAIRPDSKKSSEEEQNPGPSTEQDMLMREVDDAVRQDQFGTAAKRYGIPAGILLVLGLAGFGGWLYWNDQERTRLEQGSEQLVTALDEIEGGALEAADEKLVVLVEQGEPGAATAALMARAGIALNEGRDGDAVKLYDQIAADLRAPQPYRDLAAIRSVAANFDSLDPQEVVDRLKTLAVPGNPWFGSAGELVGMAYLAQDKQDLAGPLFAEIAKNEDVPDSLRGRTRQIAGLLGYDAVPDIDVVLTGTESSDAAEPPQTAE